jgi:NADH dehydrogenase (ubiquinone) 1 alpha subcomplex subunit 5
MLRLSRPLYQAVKNSTGITGLPVHSDPLPELKNIYHSTLKALESLPSTSVYRQGVESITQHKLKIVEAAGTNIALAEKQLDEGQIEEAIDVASDELKLVSKMQEWKAYVFLSYNASLLTFSRLPVGSL